MAFALWLLALAPQWALAWWGMKHLTRLRGAVARSTGVKLLAATSWMATILLSVAGTVWVCDDLLGPAHLDVQRVVRAGWFLDQGSLFVVALLLAIRRRRLPRATPSSADVRLRR